MDAHETNTQPTGVEVSPSVDALKLQMAMQQLRDNQNLGMAVFGGSLAAIVGAVLWAVVTAVTQWQIGFMAIGVGFLVGLAVRKMGQGVTTAFGVVGAVLSLAGCLVGNYLANCAFIAASENMGIFDVIGRIDFATAVELMTATFHPMDVLFYGLALYYGYKFSFRVVTEEELATMMKA
ncbi:MAG: hypothetical protein AB1772_11625 [Candidatus Zixiibacteriota bacterium]